MKKPAARKRPAAKQEEVLDARLVGDRAINLATGHRSEELCLGLLVFLVSLESKPPGFPRFLWQFVSVSFLLVLGHSFPGFPRSDPNTGFMVQPVSRKQRKSKMKGQDDQETFNMFLTLLVFVLLLGVFL